jgi:hypothetical protein
MSHRHFWPTLLVIVLLLLTPVLMLAQEPTAPTVDEAPGSVLDTLPPELVESFLSNYTSAQWLIIGVLLLALVAFGAQGMILAYKGASPFVQRLMAEAHKESINFIIGFLQQKRDEAALNDVDWDDPMWERLYEAGVNHREQLNQFLETLKQDPPPPAQG